MKHPSFNEQNETGRAAEERVASAFLCAGWCVEWRPAMARRDLHVFGGGRAEFVEVKNEDRYADSPNVCLEFLQGDPCRPSGWWISEATLGVSTFGPNAMIFRVRPMVVWVDCERKRLGLKLRDFGDNFNAGFIIPKRLLLEQSWADWVPVADIPKSEILRPVQVCPTSPSRLSGRGGFSPAA